MICTITDRIIAIKNLSIFVECERNFVLECTANWSIGDIWIWYRFGLMCQENMTRLNDSVKMTRIRRKWLEYTDNDLDWTKKKSQSRLKSIVRWTKWIARIEDRFVQIHLYFSVFCLLVSFGILLQSIYYFASCQMWNRNRTENQLELTGGQL